MLYLLIFILMCFFIPSFFTSIFVIGAAILPAIGTGLVVGLVFFVIIKILQSIFSSKKTETSTPHSITDSNKTYQLSDEEFDMTKEIVENKKESEQKEPDEFKLIYVVYFVIAIMTFLVVMLFTNTGTEPTRIYSEHEAAPTKEEKIEATKPEIKEVTKENPPVIETKPTPDPTDSNYIKVCNNGQLEGQGTCPKSPVLGSNSTDWACTKDKKTGLIWEVKTNDGGLRDKDWAYSWYESDDKKNGGFTGYKNGSITVGSGGNCLTPDNCNTEDFTKEVNQKGLCGAKDWRMPIRDELLTLLHCAKNQNTSPKTDGDFNRLCTDEALKDAPNINKNYFPNTESHFWTSTLTNSDPWVVVFSYGGANTDNKYFDSPVRLVRNSNKPKPNADSLKEFRSQFINQIRDDSHTKIWFEQSYTDKNDNYHVIFTKTQQLLESGKICDGHICQMDIGQITYKQKENSWEIASNAKKIAEIGEFGNVQDITRVSTIKLPKNKLLFLVPSKYAAMGEESTLNELLLFSKNEWHDIGNVEVGFDNSGEYSSDDEASKSKIAVYKGSVSIIKSDKEYPDLLVTKKGTDVDDDYNVIPAKNDVYVFNGKKYELKE